ncbi:DUF4017 family protein [Bacillus sp. S/N-304-OC-R1]|uniref:DUF4017 family protein n=1 Tax=Bacillus sp. S/N-304-OC-R1 TaxID=2758034 RepID=UPI001C8D07CB|nr:DUF4017 family protein [Bacillus sp. S/N-304-OC-R1]MBY0121539.1 DUF4017 family protein [Bacillus sp. S/N-304-OC-R1]
MSKIIPPLLSYIIVCLIAVFAPASEGYNSVGWKLFVGQIYAIPVFIIVAVITYYLNKKNNPK